MKKFRRHDITLPLPEELVWYEYEDEWEDESVNAGISAYDPKKTWHHAWVEKRRDSGEFVVVFEPPPDSPAPTSSNIAVFSTEDEALRYISTCLCLGIYGAEK